MTYRDRAAESGARFIALAGGRFLMGSEDPDVNSADGEGPVSEVDVPAFGLSPTAVSNAEFDRFVSNTGYVTDAERFGWSFVFWAFAPNDIRVVSQPAPETPWWLAVGGASWNRPRGPGSSVSQMADHPVVHVSYADASAYCDWVGGRLPTEAEWEYAARGGLEQRRFPWGDELTPGGVHMCNIWQGEFPITDSGEDGYKGTAPVTAYEPNGFGLYNVVGNAWEWCSGWFDRYTAPRTAELHHPTEGKQRVIRGGSHLCHESYCNRYRVAARSGNTPDSSSGNMGFRVAFDVVPGVDSRTVHT